jgi:hypothetical protein
MLYIYPKGSINKFETLDLFSSQAITGKEQMEFLPDYSDFEKGEWIRG